MKSSHFAYAFKFMKRKQLLTIVLSNQFLDQISSILIEKFTVCLSHSLQNAKNFEKKKTFSEETRPLNLCEQKNNLPEFILMKVS